MNFDTICGFVSRNGMKILKKTALAAGVIAGLAFLTDTPEVDESFEEVPYNLDKNTVEGTFEETSEEEVTKGD